MMKAVVVLNEQHKLLDNQKEVLQKRYNEYSIYPVPAEGWTLTEMKKVKEELFSLLQKQRYDVIFASPVPALLLMLARDYYYLWGHSDGLSCGGQIYVFHNDKREKKEVNGRIISVIAEDGWQLV